MKNIRNSIAIILGAVLTLTSIAVATPEQEKTFVDGYKKAFEAKDAAALEKFLYTKDAHPEALSFYKMMMTSEMGGKIAKIELRDLTPDEVKKATEVMDSPDGGKAKLPVTPVKKLVLSVQSSGANGSSTSSSESLVALVDGKFMIPVPVAVK